MKNSEKYLNKLYESFKDTIPTSLKGVQYKKEKSTQGVSITWDGFRGILQTCLRENLDDGLNAWANEVISATDVNDDILIRFNSTLQDLATVTDGGIKSELNLQTAKDLEYLSHLTGSDLAVAITAGALADYGWVPEFKALNDKLANSGIRSHNLNESDSKVTYSPFSMICEHNESGLPIVRIKGKNYGIGDKGKLYESDVATSGDVDSVNDAIENIPFNDHDDTWELNSPIGMITISPYEKCVRLNGDAKSCDELRESLSKAIIEPDSVLTQEDVEYYDNMLLIAENLDDIAILDQVKVFENLVNHESFVIFPNDDGTEVSVIHNGELKYGAELEDIMDYAVVEFGADRLKLNETYSKQLKSFKLLESYKIKMKEIDDNTLKELNESLLIVDDELSLVDSDSEAAEKLTTVRDQIVNGINEILNPEL